MNIRKGLIWGCFIYVFLPDIVPESVYLLIVTYFSVYITYCEPSTH